MQWAEEERKFLVKGGGLRGEAGGCGAKAIGGLFCVSDVWAVRLSRSYAEASFAPRRKPPLAATRAAFPVVGVVDTFDPGA